MRILMAVEGVLRTEVGGEPIQVGEALYRVLIQDNQVVLLAEGSHTEARRYLASRGLLGYDELVADEAALPGMDLRMRQVEVHRANSGTIDLVIEPDPARAAKIMASGLTVLLFGHPVFSRPEFRPDYEPPKRAWNDIVREMEKRVLHQYDPRLAEDPDITYWEDDE